MPGVVLLHTVQSVINTFNMMIREMYKDITILNILDEYVVKDVLKYKCFTPDNMKRLYLLLDLAQQAGPDAILVTCSTLSRALDAIKPFIKIPVLKVDEHMIKAAVQTGKHITVMATAESTLGPTIKQLEEEAARIGKDVRIRAVLCSEAYEAMLKGDMATHDSLLMKKAEEIKGQDVIVLAQASMASVEKPIQDICGCSVLSSPRLAVESLAEYLNLETGSCRS